MFRVTRYPMISKSESGRVGYGEKYRVAGRVRVPAGHWIHSRGLNVIRLQDHRDVLYSKTRVGSKALSVLTKTEQSSRKISKSQDPVFPQN